jgi:hypothetical protein
MKSVSIVVSFFLVAFMLTTSCQQNNQDDNSQNTPASGTWKVSYFWDKSDETSNYTGYTFEFKSDGTLLAAKSGQNWSGNWSSGYDDSKDKFLIQFNTSSIPSALEELQEDWIIIQMDDSLMHFEHTSGGNGDTDILKFVKN